jgi:hypothetical protein
LVLDRKAVKLILTLIEDLLNPGRNWGEFSRKMISLIVVSLVAFVAADVYWNFKETSDKFIPVSERMVTNKGASDEVKNLMQRMLFLHSEIRSIWLYSWPDAANLDVVHQVGDPTNPLPTGHFWSTDATDVGRLGLNICTKLNRDLDNTACSIFGLGDAWGVLVVVWDSDKPKPAGYEAFVASAASRITHLLYGT